MANQDAAPDYIEIEAQMKRMDDTALQRLGAEYHSLTDRTQALVRAEYARRSLEAPLVAEEPEVDGGGGVTVLRRYRDSSEAALARSVLESAGIACFLRDENTVRIDWLWSNLMGGIRLQVADSDVEAAQAILSQPIPETIAMEGQPDFQQPSCPRCQSLDISFETLDAKVGATSILLLGFPLPSPVEKGLWHCHTCDCTWTDDGAEEDVGIA
jgi:hypothetical protein